MRTHTRRERYDQLKVLLSSHGLERCPRINWLVGAQRY